MLAKSGSNKAPTTNVGTPNARPRAISASAGVETRRSQQLHLVRAVRRLDLAEPVEVAHVRRHRLDVRDDDVARTSSMPQRTKAVSGPEVERTRPAVAVRGAGSSAATALVVGEEALRPRDRRRPRQLGEHLAGARARDVDVVEERLDGRVVAGEQLEPLEGIDVVLVTVPPAFVAHRKGSLTAAPAAPSAVRRLAAVAGDVQGERPRAAGAVGAAGLVAHDHSAPVQDRPQLYGVEHVRRSGGGPAGACAERARSPRAHIWPTSALVVPDPGASCTTTLSVGIRIEPSRAPGSPFGPLGPGAPGAPAGRARRPVRGTDGAGRANSPDRPGRQLVLVEVGHRQRAVPHDPTRDGSCSDLPERDRAALSSCVPTSAF